MSPYHLPTPPPGEAHYSRLCPTLGVEHDPEKLTRLACRMKDSDEKRAARPRIEAMMSGYVYFGQFVDHDLTRDETLLSDAGPNVHENWNYRTPCLDLDHLYGKVPSDQPSIYTGQEGELRIDPTYPVDFRDGHRKPSTPDDLPRARDGTAEVVDSRSDENLAIAQMHVLFAKFHNALLHLGKTKPELLDGVPGKSHFERTRRLVTWHYQWIIVHDYLPSFVQTAVLHRVFAERNLILFPRLYTPRNAPMDLPVEFTVAAYRFGHSMVQEVYLLNIEQLVPTDTLIFMTRRGGGIGGTPQHPAPAHLRADHVVDWDFFFRAMESNLNRGQNIDTFITEKLYELPPQTVALFRAEGVLKIRPRLQELMMPLPELTLKRGAKIRLPTAEQFAEHFGLPIIPHCKMGVTEEDQMLFDDPEFRSRTPLWYYLLREASFEMVTEVDPNNTIDPPIQKLGTIGSQIIAETFLQILAADKDSILNDGIKWRPPQFVFGSSSAPRALDSMPRLVDFVLSV